MSKQQGALQVLGSSSAEVAESAETKPERARVLALSSGTTLIPLEQHKAAMEALTTDHQNAFASLEAELQAESESVVELREINDRLRQEKYTLEDQLEQTVAHLPDGDAVKVEQQSGLIAENESLTEQLNAAQATLATVFEAIGTLSDQVADGVSVIVTAQNPHGQALHAALESVDSYVTQYLPVPEGEG